MKSVLVIVKLVLIFFTLQINCFKIVSDAIIRIPTEREIRDEILSKVPPGSFPFIPPVKESTYRQEDAFYWNNIGGDYLTKLVDEEKKPKKNVAKNVIIFIGDGMGISTITATRIYKGQRTLHEAGEEHKLSYEQFPNVALVKTYNVDMTTPDSAGTATAILTGVKTMYEAVGVDSTNNRTDFDKDVYEQSRLESIMTWAQKQGKDTGIITTTRITHATPACAYAQINNRNWECDSEVPPEYRSFVKDISRQLVEDAPGKNFKVILGGGYQQLGHITDDRSNGECIRTDNLNLTAAWIEKHENDSAVFVTNNEQLASIGNDTEYLLGLFNHDHLPYELERDKGPKGTPSLTDMVKAGLKVLSKSKNGYVLLVEGGRIDHGHHKNYARLALEEGSQFDDAIAYTLGVTKMDETLILVTADHSHTMTINGYSKRGMDILGYTRNSTDDKISSILTYANGPGFDYHHTENKSSTLWPWKEVHNDTNRATNVRYQHMGAFKVTDESHSGEDVAIFAQGPGAHLIRGVFEQNYIAHLISYAACIGPRATMNDECPNAGFSVNKANYAILISLAVFICKFIY